MSAADVAEAVLLWAGVLVLVVSAVGTSLAATVLDRLHYMSLGAVGGLPLLVISQAVATPSQAPKLVVIALLEMFGSPALTTATARALDRRKGS